MDAMARPAELHDLSERLIAELGKAVIEA